VKLFSLFRTGSSSKKTRTVIYVDGFNFYYGILKYTPYKWLNIHNLLSVLIKERAPESEIIECRFYTAWTKARIASRGQKAVQAQQVYHRALESPHTPPTKVICHDHNLAIKPLLLHEPGKPPDKANRVDIWHLEEKQTDVQLALDAYAEAISGNIDQIVLVTNDTDLAPLLDKLKSKAPHIKRGLIIPRRSDKARPAAAALVSGADWSRRVINEDELRGHQFPDRVPTAKKPVDRPDYW